MDVRKEALRYLGCKGEPDEQTAELLTAAEKALGSGVKPSYCWRVMDKAEYEQLLAGSDIKKHLANSERVIVFAATLGAEADRLIRAAEVSNMAYAVVLDAYASALIESYCDGCEEEMSRRTGGNYTWRYSPGYGDYPISLQREFIKILSADKKIGLTATESYILVPRKSVTAIIGITDSERDKNRNKCESCSMKETCRLRKDGLGCGR